MTRRHQDGQSPTDSGSRWTPHQQAVSDSPHREFFMFSRSRLQTAAVLAVGIAVGHLAASGRFDSLLHAEQKATTAATEPVSCPADRCCASPDKAAALAALAAHNQKVSANLQPGKNPNILVIFGDDIGIPQISAYTQGLMGYHTPNIDRIAKEGMLFTDSYGQQSCTAG